MAMLNAPVCDYVFRIISKALSERLPLEPTNNSSRPCPSRTPRRKLGPTSPPSRGDCRSDGRIAAISCGRRTSGFPCWRGRAIRRAGSGLNCRHCRRWPSRRRSGLRLATDRRKWADERLDEMEAARVEALQAVLDRGGRREVRFERGELRLYVTAPSARKIYLDETAGRLAEAYWRWLLLSGPAREANDSRRTSGVRPPPPSRLRPRNSSSVWRRWPRKLRRSQPTSVR